MEAEFTRMLRLEICPRAGRAFDIVSHSSTRCKPESSSNDACECLVFSNLQNRAFGSDRIKLTVSDSTGRDSISTKILERLTMYCQKQVYLGKVSQL